MSELAIIYYSRMSELAITYYSRMSELAIIYYSRMSELAIMYQNKAAANERLDKLQDAKSDCDSSLNHNNRFSLSFYKT